ncbi:hypothetical protein F5X98DRAFT_198324 [Xylaria grammica]|nr:hypothetical protein F5X98DRAFT_198324 [Xylaria grammica]
MAQPAAELESTTQKRSTNITTTSVSTIMQWVQSILQRVTGYRPVVSITTSFVREYSAILRYPIHNIQYEMIVCVYCGILGFLVAIGGMPLMQKAFCGQILFFMLVISHLLVYTRELMSIVIYVQGMPCQPPHSVNVSAGALR